MSLTLFGFEISKKLKNVDDVNLKGKSSVAASGLPSFVPRDAEDGSYNISAGGYFGQYVDIDGTTVASDQDLILKYRNVAEHPECDLAINFIVDEAIVSDDDDSPVQLILDNLTYEDSVKEEIQAEFKTILQLLEFNFKATEIFRQWYIDGKLFYHVIIDPANPRDGISELRSIDPIKMQKIREVDSILDSKTGARITETTAEYYVFNNTLGSTGAGGVTSAISGLKIDPNAICYVTSGLLDSTRKRVISNLHKALKPVNQLRMMEDSLVIYRISRAPERRIFYVDVGNLPKGKAEEYMQGIMSKYRNKLVYDGQTGEIRDDRRHMSMLEDFWLPRREGGKGTEITTLPGGDNLGQIEDILFFKKNVHRCLNVPLSRLNGDEGGGTFGLGRSTEISRDEIAFQKFINRLRKKFSYLFINLLKTQLQLKGIIDQDDWDEIAQAIKIDFRRDNHFTELKDFEVLKERLTMADTIGDKLGKYYSTSWVRKNILRQSAEDIKLMDEEIAAEAAGGGGAGADVTSEDISSISHPEQDFVDDNASLEQPLTEIEDSEQEPIEAEPTGADEVTSDQASPDTDNSAESAETDNAVEDPFAVEQSAEEEEETPAVWNTNLDQIEDIDKLIALHNLRVEPSVSSVTGMKYLRLTNPLNGRTFLIDPDIITKKLFVAQLGITLNPDLKPTPL